MESLLDHRDASADDERTSEAPETSTPGEHLAEEEDLLLHLEEEEEGLIKAKAVKEVEEETAARRFGRETAMQERPKGLSQTLRRRIHDV